LRIAKNWELEFENYLDLEMFYSDLNHFLNRFPMIIPHKNMIFNIFERLNLQDINLVIYGEDPYPRLSSANGIAFWDNEISDWQKLTRGNSLKHILKALLIHKKIASHSDSISKCRDLCKEYHFINPDTLFNNWLRDGVFLINSALTFSEKTDKKQHFKFWHPFQNALIKILAQRKNEIFYLLWGNTANKWQKEILENHIPKSMIISQSHPTFQHQYLYRDKKEYSPFTELISKTGYNFLAQLERVK
jgi:uracil-DNA glycosylase